MKISFWAREAEITMEKIRRKQREEKEQRETDQNISPRKKGKARQNIENKKFQNAPKNM